MADPSKTSAPSFSFNAPSSGGGGNLFTTSSSNTGSLFGGTKNTSGGTLFGSGSTSTSAASTGTSIFGSTATSSTPSNPFSTATGSSGASTLSFGTAGSSNQLGPGGGNTKPSPFQGFTTPNKGSDATASSTTPQSLFGLGGGTGAGTNPSTQSNPFGNQASTTTSAPSLGTTTPAQNKVGSLFSFGNDPSTTPAGPPPSSTTGGPAPSLFQHPPQSSNMFGGARPSQNTAQPADGSKSSTSTTGLFANTGTQNANSLFGQKPATSSAAPASNLFGAAKPGTSSAASAFGASTGNVPSLFPSTSTQIPQPSKPETGPPSQPASSMFSNTMGQQPSASSTSQSGTPSLFSNPATKASTATAQPSFFSTPAAQQSSVSSAGTPAASAFTLGKTTASTVASTAAAPSINPTSNLFPSFGADKAKPTDAPASSATNAPSSAPTSSAPKSLFSMGAQPSTSAPTIQATTQASTAAKADAASTSALGASTTGPKPTPQSRLKNKSMDEIITRWASDLSKYQKEFQKQAEKVAEWDRMLVDNSEKIQKLYGGTLEAERSAIEVERQLSMVENDQNELEYWLDIYDKQVDDLIQNQTGQNESLQGPDQERERTYKIAETLSGRLDEMGTDLSGMIEEINAASTSLPKNKANDPLQQIVRVLNGHLTQLQQIDQGTAALQAKIDAAQKQSRTLGGLNGYGGGNEAVDDFYKSYMGRR